MVRIGSSSVDRNITIVGAPSSIGIKPYNDGSVRRLDLAPGVLREKGLSTRLAAHDLGDVIPPPRYQDVVRPTGRPRNEDDVAAYSCKLAERIAAASADNEFVLLLGGDCSIVLGGLLGVRDARRAPVGLVYVDAHADFGTLEESPSGSAASMCLALAVGRGNTRLARLGGDEPLTRMADVVHIGRRDDAEPWYGHGALRASPVLNLPHAAVREKGPSKTARAALERVAHQPKGGFWIHVDTDVLDPAIMPAVDSPLPGGLDADELAELLTPLVCHPRALGLQLTIYDPTLDPDRSCATRLVTLLESILLGTRSLDERAG
jgi:arginase